MTLSQTSQDILATAQAVGLVLLAALTVFSIFRTGLIRSLRILSVFFWTCERSCVYFTRTFRSAIAEAEQQHQSAEAQ